MRSRDPWEPKPLLDEHPWSLIPNLGLSKGASLASFLAWCGVVAVVAVLGFSSLQSLVAGAIAGAWAVHYIGARLGGRPAITGGASAPVRHDSPFQARLAFDVIALLALAAAGYVLVFKT